MDLSGASVVDVSSKLYWGPRLWRVFHLLAEISDRRDMVMLWNNLMRLTAVSMPCEQCRVHLTAYMRSHVFVRFAKIHLVTGEMVRHRARNELLSLHNDVNARLGKATFSEADIAAMYVKPRSETIAEIYKNLDEIKAAWTPLVHSRINGSAFNDWKKHIHMMVALAAGGPA